MAKPQEDVARTERKMIRYTPAELAYIESRGLARSRRMSGLRKADGSLNISAVIRDITLDGYQAPK